MNTRNCSSIFSDYSNPFQNIFPTLDLFCPFLYNQDFYSHTKWIIPQQASPTSSFASSDFLA